MPSRVVADIFSWLCCCCFAATQEAIHVDGASQAIKEKQKEAETRDAYLNGVLQKDAVEAKKAQLRKAALEKKEKREAAEREALEEAEKQAAILQHAPELMDMAGAGQDHRGHLGNDDGSEASVTSESKSGTSSPSRSTNRSGSRKDATARSGDASQEDADGGEESEPDG